MKKLVKNTFIYTLGKILPKAAGFILLPIYTRYLTPTDYGIVTSMTVLSTILVIFFTLAIDRSIYRLYFDYKTKKDKRDYLGTITISLFVISTLVLSIIFVLRNLISVIFKSIEFYPFYVYAIFMAFFSIFSIIPKIYFQINEKARKFIILSILQFIVDAGLVLWFIVGMRAGAAGMLKGRMLANIFILPLFIHISYRIINFKIKPKILIDSLSFSLPMIPMLLSAWILNLSDRIFIEKFFSLADVGIYSLGYKLGSLLLIFTGAFHLAYFPVFFKLANSHNQIEARKKLFKYNNNYILVVLIMAFLISLFSKEIIVFLMDAKYFGAYKIVAIIVLAHFIGQLSGLLHLSIYQEKKTKQIMFITLGGAIINIVLNFLLIPPLGVYGAAYATVLSFAFIFLTEYWYAKKCYFIPFNWGKIALYFIPLSAIIIITTLYWFDNKWLALISKILILLLVSVIIFWTNKELLSQILIKNLPKYRFHESFYKNLKSYLRN